MNQVSLKKDGNSSLQDSLGSYLAMVISAVLIFYIKQEDVYIVFWISILQKYWFLEQMKINKLQKTSHF